MWPTLAQLLFGACTIIIPPLSCGFIRGGNVCIQITYQLLSFLLLQVSHVHVQWNLAPGYRQKLHIIRNFTPTVASCNSVIMPGTALSYPPPPPCRLLGAMVPTGLAYIFLWFVPPSFSDTTSYLKFIYYIIFYFAFQLLLTVRSHT